MLIIMIIMIEMITRTLRKNIMMIIMMRRVIIRRVKTMIQAESEI